MKFNTEVTLDESALKALRRERLHAQCTEFAEKRAALIAKNITKFKLYSTINEIYLVGRSFNSDGEREWVPSFSWQFYWSLNEETGEALLLIDQDEVLDDTFFFGEITMYADNTNHDYYEREFAVKIPYRWIDPQLSNDKLTELMYSAAVEQLPKIQEYLVKLHQNLLNSAEAERLRLEKQLKLKARDIDKLRAKAQDLAKSFTMQDFLDM